MVATAMVERRGDDVELARFMVACLREFCDVGSNDGIHGARALGRLPWWRQS